MYNLAQLDLFREPPYELPIREFCPDLMADELRADLQGLERAVQELDRANTTAPEVLNLYVNI